MKKLLLIFSIPILLLTSCDKKITELNVLSFNIRMDTPVDSMNSWQYRKDVAAQIIKDQNADIVGTQEVLIHQLNDLKSRLPEYNAIGVGRFDGKEKGEFCAILYKKDRFEEMESGNFWLSETPEVPGVKGWDAACERVATWAILKDKETKEEFFFVNTHLDHVGKVARVEGVKLLLERAKTYGKGLPAILTGDFNATPDTDVIKHVVDQSNPDHLIHTKEVAETIKTDGGTFHNYGKVPLEKRSLIDYIFVSPGIKVKQYDVLPEKLNDIYISDHSIVSSLVQLP
ncbi:MAG: endonuclease/exonuclease/phosphatase family protein [Prevotella sp.]|jgi:endonuclease/exonuclease/phosphatase family metal-dependent hydrolase|nr:endonuclease/exonuclease/phosphatase family protein [Prevotella sp.]